MKEIGRTKDAIREFSQGAESADVALDCLEMLGHCMLEQGDPMAAVSHFVEALKGGAIGTAAVDLKFEIAQAFEASETAKARCSGLPPAFTTTLITATYGVVSRPTASNPSPQRVSVSLRKRSPIFSQRDQRSRFDIRSGFQQIAPLWSISPILDWIRSRFTNTPVSRFYYDSVPHNQALIRLTHALKSMKGLAVLSGEIGTGKTTLARRLLNALDSREFDAALMVIVHRDVTSEWLLRKIAVQIGVTAPAADKLVLLSQLHNRLLEIHQAGRKAVILIDEAQMLTTRELMEEFRGLLNLETPAQKLISFVFFGLPEIEENLAKRSALGPAGSGQDDHEGARPGRN